MIKIEEVINIHDILIDRFGGSHGIRDHNALESAINRPFMTFDQKELYPSQTEKAAALIESLITNHPFLDGNKRIGYVIMRFFLLRHGFDINASQSEKFEFVINIAQGQLHFEQINNWISDKLRKL
ncbi:MAG: type II toxin-antitoxin system death-on-curing family toxin [Bacteroidales bacterium]